MNVILILVTLTFAQSHFAAPLTSLRDSMLLQKAVIPLTKLAHLYEKELIKSPVVVKALKSLVGFGLGDLVAQGIGKNKIDYFRLIRQASYGCLFHGTKSSPDPPPPSSLMPYLFSSNHYECRTIMSHHIWTVGILFP